jgi:hypothetical protein
MVNSWWKKKKKTFHSPKTLVLVFAYVDYCSNKHPWLNIQPYILCFRINKMQNTFGYLMFENKSYDVQFKTRSILEHIPFFSLLCKFLFNNKGRG